MAGLLYFLPDCERSVLGRIADAGAHYAGALEPVLGGSSLECRRGIGPDKAEGLLVAPEPSSRLGTAATCEYKPAEQVWYWVEGVVDVGGKKDPRPTPGPRYAIGYWTAARPGPDDLERRSVCPGREVELGDGNRWDFPVVGPTTTSLPHSFRRAKDGNFTEQMRPKYEDLFAQSERWFSLLRDGGTHTHAEFFHFAIAALAVNYCLGPVEASGDVLDLIGVEHRDAVMRACLGLIDRDEERARKKKDSQPA